MDNLSYIPAAFEKKRTHTIEMPVLNLEVSRLRPEIVITRTKDDPGAIHMGIQTKGGTAAILRYAYSEPATKKKVKAGQSLYRIKTKYNVANLIVGSFSGPLEDDKNKLLELLLAIVSTNEQVPCSYDRDGFIRLVRRYHSGRSGEQYGDVAHKESYHPEINIECCGIRDEKDEIVVALVNAICMWGNKVDVHYNTYGPHMYYANNKVNNMVLRNHTIIDAMDEMNEAGLSDNSINLFISRFSSMFELVEDMPVYHSNPRRRTGSPPPDGYYYWSPDFDF